MTQLLTIIVVPLYEIIANIYKLLTHSSHCRLMVATDLMEKERSRTIALRARVRYL